VRKRVPELEKELKLAELNLLNKKEKMKKISTP